MFGNGKQLSLFQLIWILLARSGQAVISHMVLKLWDINVTCDTLLEVRLQEQSCGFFVALNKHTTPKSSLCHSGAVTEMTPVMKLTEYR